MNYNTNNSISINELSNDFSKVTRLVDTNGAVVILKNDSPRYIIVQVPEAEETVFANEDDVMSISKRLIEKNRHIYEELAK